MPLRCTPPPVPRRQRRQFDAAAECQAADEFTHAISP